MLQLYFQMRLDNYIVNPSLIQIASPRPLNHLSQKLSSSKANVFWKKT